MSESVLWPYWALEWPFWADPGGIRGVYAHMNMGHMHISHACTLRTCPTSTSPLLNTDEDGAGLGWAGTAEQMSGVLNTKHPPEFAALPALIYGR